MSRRDLFFHFNSCAGARQQSIPDPPDTAAHSGALYATVVKIFFNPRMVLAVLGILDRGINPEHYDVKGAVEVVVGDNRKLWIGAPMEVKLSSDYPGYYEFVGELPRGRWDRVYGERFVLGNRAASSNRAA